MRTGGSLDTAASTMTTTKATFSSPPKVTVVQRSPWHSPLPYLFGGLAAMLGLIAFALLILACSYWKLSSHSENGEGGERDLEAGEDDKPGDSSKALPVFEEKILVIMAGDAKPTFLATPMSMSSRASSFGDDAKSKKGDREKEREEAEIVENEKTKQEEMGHQDHTETTTIQGTESSQETH